MLDALGGIGRELDAAGLGVALDQRIQPGLVDRNLAAVQPLDLAGIDIDTDDMVARIRQTGAGDQADVAGAENRDAHLSS